MILGSSVDRFNIWQAFELKENSSLFDFTQKGETLQGKLHNCDDVWRCCNCLKENNYSAQLRLSIRHHSHTLYPVQLRILG